MSENGDNSNVIGVRTVYDAVLRLEGKLDQQGSQFSTELDSHKAAVAAEIDAVKTEQTYLRGRMDGSLAMIKWLGPTGVAAVLFAAAKAAGLIP